MSVIGATKCSEEQLRTIVESITLFGSWARAAQQAYIGESTCYTWLSKSRAQQKAGDRSPPLYLTIGEREDWWHNFCREAKDRNVMSQLFLAVEQNKVGICEDVRDPATGYRIPRLAPEFLGVSDDAMTEQLLDPVRDRWIWKLNEAGERIEPEYEQKWVNVPASLRAKFFAGLLPKQFGDKLQVAGEISHRVVNVQVVPAPFVPRVAPPIDAEFTELPIERQDIADLRAHAARLMADPNRASARASRPVNLGVVGPDLPPTRSDASETDGAAQPRGSAAVPPTIIDPVRVRAPAPVAPQPQEMAPAPSYQRRPSTKWGHEGHDPTKAGAKAMKVG